jgi:hypothetical protein
MKNRGALSAATCNLRRENIRRLLRPKGGNAAQKATDGCRLSALRWTTRKGRECPGKRVLFLSCLAVRAKRHTGSNESRPLGPNCRYSEPTPINPGEGTLTFCVTEAPHPPLPSPHWLCPPHRHPSPMLAPPPPGPIDNPAESLALYSQSLRDYTLRLWVESRRQAEERVHGRNRKKSHTTAKMIQMPTSACKLSDDGNSSTGTPNDGLILQTNGSHA